MCSLRPFLPFSKLEINLVAYYPMMEIITLVLAVIIYYKIFKYIKNEVY